MTIKEAMDQMGWEKFEEYLKEYGAEIFGGKKNTDNKENKNGK